MSNFQQQAPQMMQTIAPDLAAQQVALQRQQQMADMLRQKGMEAPDQTQSISGIALRQSPLIAMSKALQAIAGGYMQQKADEKGLELGKAMQGRMSDSFDQMAGGTGQTYQPQMANGEAPLSTYQAGGSTVGDTGQQSVPVSQPTQQDNQLSDMRRQAKMAYMLGNTELSNKLIENMSLMTDAQKNDRYRGISANESGDFERARLTKDGTMSFAPGQTNVLPGGKRIVAADFNNGTQGGYDANNNPTISEIPNSSAIAASRAGQISAAQEAPKLLPLGYVGSNNRPMGGTIGEYTGSQQQGQQAPMNLGLQSRIDLLKSIQDPEQRQSLVNTVYKNIESAPPQIRDALGQQWSNAVNGTPQQGQAGSPGNKTLQSASEAAMEAANVKSATEPQLGAKNQAYKDSVEYEKNLNAHVSESQALLQRIGESRQALTKFQSGGGAESRATLASMAQAIPGMPISVVDKIAGGNLSAMQEFQKYAAQEALGTMNQALASDSGPGSKGNRIAMELFIKNNPNLPTDPRAIEKIFNFQTGLHNQLLDQSNTYQTYKDKGEDVTKFPNYWANQTIQRGYVKPEIKTGYAKGVATPANVQSVLDKYK